MAADRQRVLTFILVCLVMMIDDADQNLLPAVYLEVCQEFNALPSTLGLATMSRGLVQSMIAIVAGPLGSRYDRIYLVSFGCLLWGIASALVGASNSISFLLLSRACNGVGIGLVIPLVYSLVADLAPDAVRGRAFGIVYFSSNFGRAAGGFLATTLAASPERSLAGGIIAVSGWRFAFYLVSAISCVMAALLLCLGREPRTSEAPTEPNRSLASPAPAVRASSATRSPPPASLSVHAVVSEARTALRVPTFVIILIQGAVGTAP